MSDKVYTVTARQLYQALKKIGDLEYDEVTDLMGMTREEADELPDEEQHIFIGKILDRYL